MDPDSSSTQLTVHAAQLAALGHPLRLSVLRFLVRRGPKGASAGEIQERVQLPASTLSHHLKRLLEVGLIETRSEGPYHFYSPALRVMRQLSDYLWEDCCGGETACC